MGEKGKNVKLDPCAPAKVAIYCNTGERALDKEETINKWMEADRERDEKLENTEPPTDIICPNCGEEMTCDHKDLYEAYNPPLRVLFLFRCSSCRKGRGIFDNGKEWEVKQQICPKCSAILKEKYSHKGKAVITTYTCLNCPYKDKEVFEPTKIEEEKLDPNFERDRARFCLSKEQKDHYYAFKIKLNNVTELLKESKEREKHKDIYDAAAKLQKLTIDQLEQKLIKAFKKHGYEKLRLAQPQIDKYVIVPFTIRDTKPKREKHASELELRRLFNEVLEPTSWRLMTDSVSYRLGILSGRLKGYELEKDLVKLVEQINKRNKGERYKKNESFAKDGRTDTFSSVLPS